MTTRVTFENATIRDVISKAAKIAPSKSGQAMTTSGGIMIDVDVPNREVVVRATNGEVFYMEIVDTVEVEGESTHWRIPSSFLDGICSKLSISSGAQVSFTTEGPQIVLKSARMVARLRLIDPTYYPQWESFDPTALSPVQDFGTCLQKVQWAASKTGTPPKTGIHLSGSIAGATDNYRIAMTPCHIPQLYEPVTIPANTFATMMKAMGEVSIGLEDGQLLVMPDASTQIRAVIFADPFPNIERLFQRQETNAILVKREYLIEMIEQAMVIGAHDRTPLLKFIVGLQELAVLMEDQEMGLLGNVMDITGQANHDRHYIGFTPDNLLAALRASPEDDVTIYYVFGMPMKPVRIDGGAGYEVLVMPRNLEKSAE